MAYGFLDVAATPSVKAAQAANGSLALWDGFRGDRAADRFTPFETAFIAKRDSFYLATTSERGWPYVQHRGGPPGFLKVLDEKTLGFADFSGNRQYLSVGNLTADDRASLILVDYVRRRRLKIMAHVEIRDLTTASDLAERLVVPEYRASVERAMVMRLVTFDWNCPQHITPRFTTPEVEQAASLLRDRVAQLESENERLRSRLPAHSLDAGADPA